MLRFLEVEYGHSLAGDLCYVSYSFLLAKWSAFVVPDNTIAVALTFIGSHKIHTNVCGPVTDVPIKLEVATPAEFPGRTHFSPAAGFETVVTCTQCSPGCYV